MWDGNLYQPEFWDVSNRYWLVSRKKKQKDHGECIETLEYWKSRLRGSVVGNNTKVTLQMGPRRMALEWLSLGPGHALKLWTQMTSDTGHGCWHCHSVAPRTRSHNKASNPREALSGSLLPCIFSPLVKDQSRWIWLVEPRSHALTLASRGIGTVCLGHF